MKVIKNNEIKKIMKTLSCITLVAGMSTSCSMLSANKNSLDNAFRLQGSQSFVENGIVAAPWLHISITNYCYRNMFITNPENNDVKPDLIEDYEVSEDGLTYEFTLKDDLKWSDGEKIGLEDIVFSFESVLRTERVTPLLAKNFEHIKGAKEYIDYETDSIEGVYIDGDKLVIELTKPMYRFISILAQFAILPEHCFENEDITKIHESDFWLDPVVSGIYKKGEHVVGEYVTYEYNENYGGKKPKIETLLLRSDFEYEEIDFATTSNMSRILSSRAIPFMREIDVESTYYRYLVYNIDRNGEVDPVIGDVRVRYAISCAIDAETAVSEVYYNATGMVENFERYDKEKAIRLLEDAEYDFDRPLVLLNQYSDEFSVKFINEIVKSLEDVGFVVEVVQGGDLYSDEFDYYDIALKDLSTLDDFEWFFEYTSCSEVAQNIFGINETFDTLFDEWEAVTTDEDRERIFDEMSAYAVENVYKFPLMEMNHKAYINKNKVELPSDLVLGSAGYKYDMQLEDWAVKE